MALRRPRLPPLACLLAAGLLAGCAETGEPVARRGFVIDYRGPDTREFFVEGTSTVTVEPSYVGAAERRERALELVAYKHIVLEWYLYLRVADSLSPDRETLLGDLHAHVRNGATEDLELTDVGGGTYAFRFRGELSAPLELFDLFPGDAPDADGGLDDAGADGGLPADPARRLLRLSLPVLDNEEMAQLEPGNEWYRAWGRSLFDPATYEGELETIDLTVTPEERSLDGYIDHRRLLEDDRLTVGIHVGWDYYPERFDRRHSMQVYDWLVAQGFRSPAESFDYYGIDSGPLTKTVTAGGRPVEVEVTLVHSLQGDAGNIDFARRLKDALLESFREREVIVYLGHSGNHHGFLLGDWNAVPYEVSAVRDYELPALEMSDAYQLVLADGCFTYSMGEPFYANPAKVGRTNLDLVATTNLSVTPDAGDHAVRLLVALFGRDGRPPRGTSYDELLGAYRPLETYMGLYGVHGIDDNPRLNPFADVGLACAPCELDEDCGPSGSACLRVNRRYVCLPECLADDGCPEGTVCREHEDRIEWGRPHGYCVPSDGVCDRTSPDAGTDVPGDASSDGEPDAALADAEDAGLPPADVPVPPVDAAGDAASEDPSAEDSGCGCRATGPRRGGTGLVLGLLALLSLRRAARRDRAAASLRDRPSSA